MYTIYKTTNIHTGQFYIGKHETNNPDDSYLGSGLRLKRAIKKYGTNSFRKEILFVFDTEEEAITKEIEIVDTEFVKREDTYNIALGGQGGVTVLEKGHPLYESTCKKISEAQLKRSAEISKIMKRLHVEGKTGRLGKPHTEETKAKMSATATGIKKTKEHVANSRAGIIKFYQENESPLIGRKASAETRQKISDNHHDVTGENNPMYGNEHSAKTKRKMSERAKKRKRVTCEFCERSFTKGNHTSGTVKNVSLIRKIISPQITKVLDKMKSFSIVEFGPEDIVRSGLVKEYIILKESMNRETSG